LIVYKDKGLELLGNGIRPVMADMMCQGWMRDFGG
jgi:hypothetical protein